jgi:hypothetical protein
MESRTPATQRRRAAYAQPSGEARPGPRLEARLGEPLIS